MILEAHSIEAAYGDVRVLKGISLRIGEGELVALFGPNGHGKSTLLKVICGLIKPTAGHLEYGGVHLSDLDIPRIVEMGVVYVPEDRHLFPEMTVLENLKMGAFPKRARAAMSENLEFVFHLFPKLKSLAGRAAGTLSGGEARMLTIGRGLMADAEFLAIDEPSMGLAPNLRVEVFEKISEIRKRGVSILLVEQSTSLAANLADRMYFLEDGRIVFEGRKEEAYHSQRLREMFFGIA